MKRQSSPRHGKPNLGSIQSDDPRQASLPFEATEKQDASDVATGGADARSATKRKEEEKNEAPLLYCVSVHRIAAGSCGMALVCWRKGSEKRHEIHVHSCRGETEELRDFGNDYCIRMAGYFRVHAEHVAEGIEKERADHLAKLSAYNTARDVRGIGSREELQKLQTRSEIDWLKRAREAMGE
jgi:hypothetical protein